MGKPHKIIGHLSLLVVMEIIAIICLCRRYELFGLKYERLSQKYSELYSDYQEASRQQLLLSDELLQKVTRAQNGKEPIRVCPQCGGDVLPLVYGLVNADRMDSLNYDLSGKLRHIYAGCNVGEAEWACTRCGREFKEEDGVLKQTTGIKGRRADAFLGDISGQQHIHVTAGGVNSVGIDSCFFFDITGDAVPEIWLLTEGSEADRLVLVYSLSDWGRELFRDTAGHSEFYAGRGYVLRQEAHMGYAHWYRLHWDGKAVVSKLVFKESTGGDYTTPEEKRFEDIRPEDLDPNELIKWIM